MSRIRKGSRVWTGAERLAAAARVMVPNDGGYFTIEPRALFAREAPLEVELGAGRGDFIIARAAAHPERNFLAVELAGTIAQLMAIRAGRAGLQNLRVARMDARPLVTLMLPDASVAAYHIYFPDPWPKERHVKHRLFTPAFAAGLRRTLRPGAPLYVATDVADYAEAIFATLDAAGFVRVHSAAPGAELTGFAMKFRAQGRAVHAGAFHATSGTG
jgi:tRNA (guanine-N7-)-methyltransferase